MVLAIYNMAVDEEVTDALKQTGVTSYTKWPRVLGQGKTSGPRLDSHVWPGANCVTMVVADDALAEKVMTCMHGLRDHLGQEGIKAYLLNVEAQI